MSILSDLTSHFTGNFPRLATGKYIHLILVRHSQSFPIFQTDGILNTARTQAGLVIPQSISRLVMFKRKQITPERLSGRELLRNLNITSSDENATNYCEYNGGESCKQCPDCIIYGFAIGDSGSERSKVYSDSAFSLSPYEKSHRTFTFNAPFEGGTMSEAGVMRSAINEQDHILPEVIFPTVETLRDLTYEAFIYVVGNLLRTRRYGAQESRTGTMKNHLVGVVFSDGEIFSNLYMTQAIYDALKGDLTGSIDQISATTAEVVQELLQNEPVRKTKLIFQEDVKQMVSEINALYQTESELKKIITTLNQQTNTYAEIYGAKVKEIKGKSKKK